MVSGNLATPFPWVPEPSDRKKTDGSQSIGYPSAEQLQMQFQPIIDEADQKALQSEDGSGYDNIRSLTVVQRLFARLDFVKALSAYGHVDEARKEWAKIKEFAERYHLDVKIEES